MNLNYNAPINFLGYGQVGINLLAALDKLGHEISLFPINPQNIECDPKHNEMLRKTSQNAMFYDCHAPTIKVWHQWDMAMFPGKGPRVGFPIFELDSLTELERHHLDTLDQVFVCSKWAKNVVNQYTLSSLNGDIDVVPLGVDLDIFKRIGPKPRQDKTIFINVGKWEYRKGHDVIVECFAKAFKPSDKVELWMCNENPFLKPDKAKAWTDLYKNILGDKVRLIPRQSSQAQLAHLMSKATYGIFPARAEGWNLEVLELMALGIPSIVTNYAGHTEFCNADNSYLVNIDETEVADDGIWFKPGGIVNQGNWAKITSSVKENIIEGMRLWYKIHQDGENMVNEFCINTAKEYSWENAAKTLVTYL
jgi:glycosyltransferase involved in cell wall biosynthesis